MNNLKWSFYNIWNQSLDIGREDRKLEERNHIWASELGGSFIDRFLKMKAVVPSNPPNERSRRKFEGGNIWEFVVRLVLLRAGIMKNAQHRVSYQYDDLLEVTGKLDFLAGGNCDYDQAVSDLQELEALGLPKFFIRTTESIVSYFKEHYQDGLEELPLEIKSCSSFMYDKYEKSGCGNPNHRLQLFHYLKGDRKEEGHLVYVCRDDARLLELGVFNPSTVEDEYLEDIRMMSGYIKANEQPPKEKMVVFDSDFGRFSANWKVGYSQYLSMLYGFENQFEFDNTFKPLVGRWNRVLGRVARGQNMTKNNLEAVEEMKKYGFDEEYVLEKAKNIKLDLDVKKEK